jgi:hypothetical protein
MYHYVELDHLFIFIISEILCRKNFLSYFLFSLRYVHHLKTNYARRLIKAVIENIPLTEEIFKSNDQIINNSINSKNRTKT